MSVSVAEAKPARYPISHACWDDWVDLSALPGCAAEYFAQSAQDGASRTLATTVWRVTGGGGGLRSAARVASDVMPRARIVEMAVSPITLRMAFLPMSTVR